MEINKPLAARPRMIGWHGTHGIGKSVLAAQAAEFYWRTKQWRTRVISIDSGSSEQYEKGISEGYIDYMAADGWTSYAPDMLFTSLAEGEWPEDHNIPNSILRPGYEDIRLCPKCGKDSGSRGFVSVAKCATCKQDVGSARLSVTRNLLSLKGIGLVIFEGMSMVGKALLEAQRQSRPGDKFYYGGDEAAQRIARAANEALKKKAEKDRTPDEIKAILAAKELEAQKILGLASSAEQGHYFKAGLDMMKILKASNRCPVPTVIWTAHSGRWEEPVNRDEPQSGMRLLGLGPMTIPAKLMMSALPDFVIFGHLVVENNARVLHLDRHKGMESQSILWEAKCNIVGMPKTLVLPDPLKGNGFEALVSEIAKAKGK